MTRRWPLVLAFALVFAWLPGLNPGMAQAADEPQYTWEGVWNSDFGRMTLDATGNGRYEGFNPGTITATIKPGNVLEGTWNQPGDPPKKGTLTFTMSFGGRSFTGEWHYDSGGCGSACGWNGTCVEGACLQNGASPSPSPAAPGEVVATAGSVTGDVYVSVGGGPRTLLKVGDPLPPSATVSVGVDAGLTIAFPDGSRMIVDELTELLVADVAVRESRLALTAQLILGKVTSEVRPRQGMVVDWRIVLPSGSTSARGTIFTVSVDRAGVSLVSVQEGTVSVDPDGAGLSSVDVTEGHEVAMTRSAISPVTMPGRAAGELPGEDRANADDEGLSPVVVGLAVLLLLGISAGLLLLRARGGRPESR